MQGRKLGQQGTWCSELTLALGTGPSQPAPPHQSSGQSEEQAIAGGRVFSRQTKGPLQRLSHRHLSPLAGLTEWVRRGGRGVWACMGTGERKSVTSPVASRHRKTKTHSSPWEQSPMWGPVSPANCFPRRPGPLSAAAVCVLGPHPPKVFGSLRALPVAPAVCNALPSDCPVARSSVPQNPGAHPPETCPSALRRSSRPIALHPGARFPSLLSFLMSSQFYSCSWTLGSPCLHKIQAL